MTEDDKDPTHRFDNGEWDVAFVHARRRGAILMLLVVVIGTLAVMGLHSCFATEYTFAPHTPAAFRATVRKVIRSRPACEAWEETPVVAFWQPAPLTFMAIKAAYITPTMPGYTSLPGTEGEIYRRGNIAAWVFRSGSRDFITVSTGIRTSKADMIADINAELDTWRKGR